MNKIRIIDFGDVNWLDSQAIYHAVAHTFNEETPDTLTIMSPIQTYACIGYFQDLKKEIDTEFCLQNNIPVIRREVGGGAVLLDRDQLFFHFIFNKDKLTRDINKLYSMFLEPAINTYNRLGIKAYHRPINDIQVESRKIGGTGAVEIGGAMVVVGSFMFDFNYELMVKILKIPTEKFRDKLYQNVKDYITNIKRESGYLNIPIPSRDEVKSIFFDEVGKKFSAFMDISGSLDDNEQKKLKEMRIKLTGSEWLDKKGKFLDRKVKVSSGVYIYEGNFKSPGGLIRATFTVKDNDIADIDISGDFTLMPQESLTEIENAIRGLIDYNLMALRLKAVYERFEIRSPGVVPEDFVSAIKNVLEKPVS